MKNLPENLQREISQKGFVVYHYISFLELMQTVNRDYLRVISVVNIPLAVLTVVLFFALGSLVFWVLATFYCLLFVALFVRLLFRTREYLHISNVIFSEQGILIGKDVLPYSDTKKREEVLGKYEEHFDEYLTRPSKISEVIAQKKKSLFEQTKKMFLFVLKFSGGKKPDSSRFQLAALAGLALYSVLLFIFYYIGIFLGYIFFGIFAGVLKMLLFFSKKTELQMKFSVEALDQKIHDLHRTESVLAKKIERFSGGEISDIAGFVGEKFTHFYSLIQAILDEQKKVENIISASKYKKFINFQKFSRYVKNQYNKPVTHMLGMLEKYAQKISDQKILVEQALKNLEKNDQVSDPENSAHLTKKLLRLEQMEKDAHHNLEKMKMMAV